MKTRKPTLLPGDITISRPQGDGCDYISLQIVDEISRTRFVTVRVKYADFATALTGCAHADCQIEVNRLDLVGFTIETKRESVPFDVFKREDQQAIAAALAPFEIDGWVGDRENLFNHYRRNPDGTQQVNFKRHVDSTGRAVS